MSVSDANGAFGSFPVGSVSSSREPLMAVETSVFAASHDDLVVQILLLVVEAMTAVEMTAVAVATNNTDDDFAADFGAVLEEERTNNNLWPEIGLSSDMDAGRFQ